MIREVNDPALPPGFYGKAINFPKITDADRAAGFFDLFVLTCAGATEKIRLFRPDPAEAMKIEELPTMVERYYALTAHSIRRPLDGIAPPCYLLIYIVAHYLISEASGLAVMDPNHDFGRLLLEIIKPGLSRHFKNPSNN